MKKFLFLVFLSFFLFLPKSYARELTEFDTNVFEDFFSHEISTFSTEIQHFNVKPLGASSRYDINDTFESWETTKNIVSASFSYDSINSADVWTTPTDFYQYYAGSESYDRAFSYQYGNIGSICPNSNFFNFYLSYMIEGGLSFYGLNTYAEYIIPTTGISGLCEIYYWGANQVEMQVVCSNVPTNFTNINVNIYYDSPLYNGEQYRRVGQMTINSRYSCVESSGTNDDIIINQNNNTSNIINNQNQNTDKIVDSITNNQAPDNLVDLENAVGWLPAGPVDSILNMPISISNRLLELLSYSGSECSPITIPLPYLNNKNLIIPCFSTISAKIDGLDSFLFSIQSIASAFILYYYLKDLYSWVNSIILLDKNVKKGGV